MTIPLRSISVTTLQIQPSAVAGKNRNNVFQWTRNSSPAAATSFVGLKKTERNHNIPTGFTKKFFHGVNFKLFTLFPLKTGVLGLFLG